MTSLPATPSPDDLVALVAETSLLRNIDRRHLEGLKHALQRVPLPTGATLFRQADPVDSLYFLVNGLLQVTRIKDDGEILPIAEVQPGATVGEMQILTGGTRSATITALQDSQLIRLGRDAFDRFLSADHHVLEEITKTILPRLYRDQLVQVLPSLFGELTEAALHDLEQKMSWLHLPRGEILCGQGDASESFYILVSGRLQVLVSDQQGAHQVVGQVAQGECVGEMGVFTGEQRSATLVAIRDCELVQFSKDQFHEFVAEYPQLMTHMIQLLIQRLKKGSQPRTRLSSSITFVPTRGDVPIREFAWRICAALSQMDTCLLLTSELVDTMVGIPGIAQAEEGKPDDLRLRSWLNEQEKRHRYLIFQSEHTASAWTKRCIRQADEIVYVGRATGDPRLSEAEQEVLRQEQENGTAWRRSLALLHPDGSHPPSGTARWLKERQVQRHFHLRMDGDSDFNRLARFVAGRAVGLVLSGGGARGFAHVGTVRAMQEAGIPIDLIGGVSMGALLAAGYACSDDFAAMADRIKSQLKGALNDYTIPLVSLACGRRFDSRIKKLFGDLLIEDLWVPFFCVSSNLTRGEIVIHRDGPLWRSVRASGSLPGIVPPVIEDGDLLYDGCLLDNLPMDVMRDEVGEGTVIAVDVVPPIDLEVEATEIESPSGLQILWSRLNPFVRRIQLPNILSIMQRAGQIGCVRARQQMINRHIADLYLRPPVDAYDIVDFSTVDETASIGYEYAETEFARWLKQREQAF